MDRVGKHVKYARAFEKNLKWIGRAGYGCSLKIYSEAVAVQRMNKMVSVVTRHTTLLAMQLIAFGRQMTWNGGNVAQVLSSNSS